MFGRRGFLLQVLSAITIGAVDFVWAQVTRKPIPRGTDRKDLVNVNPAEVDASSLEITKLEDFGVMGLDSYEAELKSWQLIVDGNVGKPLSLQFEDVLKLPPLEKAVLLVCPGFFVNHGIWTGFSLNELLKQAEVKGGTEYLTIRGPEGNYEKVERFNWPDIVQEKVFLAYKVNGVLLPKKHGFPLRVVAQDHYGSQWVKYVYRITAHA
ncbi:molybdopterin-dependent oxidoreductase [Desulfomonile tiedjei]|uniref:Sulfite oxidase-like oxidoreductase n=1 Tax=Desulfomonile tiedjei (strain ATCC 49306 / DSM 6799 / DCB-1) TaxID=706587 RepID=I4C8F8_DESTA|nr:molybdopterin-dependent oxidoreductase [Desulfomonile tiedjei]AFM25849.1 sulfite oxidase-like oxidoreductase [Desulfomonile tiedjei DSM 6799]